MPTASKIYSKKDFESFMSTLELVKNFNDCITFSNGVAYYRSVDRTMMIKTKCECLMDIELTKLANKIPIFNAYIGDTVEIGKDDRNYIINNGSDIIKFPIASDPLKIEEADYTTKFSSLIDEKNKLFSWDIPSDKFNAILKFFEGFSTCEITFDKDSNSPIVNLRVGDETTTGCAQIQSFDLSTMEDKSLLDQLIKTSCMFEFISALGKKFDSINLSVYYNPAQDWIISVSDIKTDFCTMQMFRPRPRITSTYQTQLDQQ